MNNYSTITIGGYPVLACDLSDLQFDKRCVINTVNQYSFVVAESDAEFKKALINSDVLLPDGIGITSAIRILKFRFIKKIAGHDLHQHIVEQINQDHGHCFYLGSTNHTLSLIKQKIKQRHPNIRTSFYSPPFVEHFTDDENNKIINMINEAEPDVLFVGMTAPKQEKWVQNNKHRLKAKVICSIGAVFDYYAETIRRPSKFWQNLGLEWFVRLVKEPRRLFKRYVVYGPKFLYLIVKLKVNQYLPD